MNEWIFSLLSPTKSHKEEYDHEEYSRKAKAQCKACCLWLKSLLPEEPGPILQRYERLAKVCLRRVRTGSLYAGGVSALPQKKRLQCSGDADYFGLPFKMQWSTSRHLIRDCPRLARHRWKCILKLPASLQLANLQKWIIPSGEPEHRKCIFDSLIDYLQKAELLMYC